jgi:WD40 repeat protein
LPWRRQQTERPGLVRSAGDAKTYSAFISYSHAVDGKLAPALQRALHGFAKPWYRLRALRVFRDEASLSASPGLWPSIEQALAGTEFFILLASPEAARSEWVTREVGYWREHKPLANFLIVLTDGELVWDGTSADFAWEQTTSLPSSLQGVFLEEPRWVDLRWARTAEDLSLRHPGFRQSVADLAAPLHGRAKDELVGDDVRQHRRTLRLARSAVALLATLALVASTAAWIAVDRGNEARRQRDVAVEQARLATSRYLAAQAVAKRPDHLDLSLLLSVEAERTHNTVEAHDALLGGLEDNPRLTFLHATAAVSSVAFSPDGQALVSGDASGTVQLWDVPGRRPLGKALTGHRGPVYSVAFSPNGRTLASGGDQTIRLWDLRSHRQVGEPLTTTHAYDVFSVAFSPNGHTIASGGDLVYLWDLPNRGSRNLLTNQLGAVHSVAFSPDGRTLSAGDDNGITSLWHIPGEQTVSKELTGHTAPVRSVAFSPDGRTLASGGQDNTILLWDQPELGRGARLTARLTGHRQTVAGLAFSPDGRTLASAGDDHTVRLWDVPGRRPLGKPLTGHRNWVTSVAFSPDGRTLASSGEDGRILLWDVPSRRRIGRPLASLSYGVNSVAFSPDGRTLASGDSNAEILLWDVPSRRRIGKSLTGHTHPVYSVAFSPDGRSLASGGEDGRFLLWQVQSRIAAPLRYDDPPVRSVAFSPDGHLVAAAGDDGTIRLFDVPSLAPVGELLTGVEVQRLAFSPDGRTLASSGDDVLLWDVPDRRRLGMALTDLQGVVYSTAFSPDGHILAAGDGDGVIALWTNDARSLEARACATANRNLSRAEWQQFIGSIRPYQATCPGLPIPG